MDIVESTLNSDCAFLLRYPHDSDRQGWNGVQTVITRVETKRSRLILSLVKGEIPRPVLEKRWREVYLWRVMRKFELPVCLYTRRQQFVVRLMCPWRQPDSSSTGVYRPLYLHELIDPRYQGPQLIAGASATVEIDLQIC
jgi:hypothetical protein